MERGFLAFVGIAYLGLAAWCSADPDTTSKSMGFGLVPGSGQSEYLVLYGGMQAALGLLFLWPIVRPETSSLILGICTLVHGCLVAFRLWSFFRFAGIQQITYALATSEWVILILSAILVAMSKSK